MLPHLYALLLHPGIPLAEKVFRTAVVYVFLLVSLRLAGKRELGQLNAFDLVVLLLLASTLQNAIIGPDNSVVGGVVGATTLLVVNYAMVRFLYRHQKLEHLIEGDADVLIHRGHVIDKNLARELITRDELEAAARRQGIARLELVEEARIEVGGALTFCEWTPTEDQRHHAELMNRLARMESLLTKLATERP